MKAFSSFIQGPASISSAVCEIPAVLNDAAERSGGRITKWAALGFCWGYKVFLLLQTALTSLGLVLCLCRATKLNICPDRLLQANPAPKPHSLLQLEHIHPSCLLMMRVPSRFLFVSFHRRMRTRRYAVVSRTSSKSTNTSRPSQTWITDGWLRGKLRSLWIYSTPIVF